MEYGQAIDSRSFAILRGVLENIPDAVAIADTNAEFTVYNRTAAKLLGIETSDASADCATRFGVFLEDGITPCPNDELPLLRALRGETTQPIVLTIRNSWNPQGITVSSNARPLRDSDGRITGAILVCHDVSTLRSAELERTRTLASLKFLADGSALLGASLDYKASIGRLALLAVSDFADLCTCGLVGDDGTFEIVARTIKGRGAVAEPAVRYHLSSLAEDHPVAVCMRTAEPVVIAGIAGNAGWTRSVGLTEAQRELLRSLDLDLYILAPISAQSKVFGVMSFGFRRADSGPSEPESLAFASEVGRRIGVAIENSLLNQTLAASEARHRVLTEALPQLVWACRPDGYCVYLSPQWVEYTGVPANQHLGWNWNQALHPEDQARSLDAWRTAAAGNGPYDVVYRMLRSDGTYRWFKARGVPLRDAEGAVTQWFGTSTDIDDQKKIHEAEKESRERLSAALAASGTGTFRWNIVTNELSFDENLNRLFGLPPGNTLGTLDEFLAIVHPDDRAGVLACCAHCATEGADFDMEYRTVWPDGSVHWLYDRGKTFMEGGTPSYMTGACVDITAQLEAARRQTESERLVRELLEAIPQMVWTTDSEGNAEYLNSRWVEYTGCDVTATRDGGWANVFHPDDLDATAKVWLRALSTGEPYQAEHRMRSASGEYRWFLTRGVRLRNSQSEAMRWFGTSTDITEQKLADEERAALLRSEKDARAEAEAAAGALTAVNEELQHFVYAASHDIQAPLRTMAMYSELVMRRLGPTADESTHTLLDFINSNAKRLSRLLSELLTYAKAGTDPVPMQEVVDIQTVMNTVAGGLRPFLEASGAEISTEPLPHVIGSSSQLAELLQNLITNAVKYSRPGIPPRIGIRARDRGEFCQITVEDNGQGFDPDYARTIFEVFKRLHGDSVEGTGIGLALCKRIVERHGGTIWADSVPGQGSSFHFTLPSAGHAASAGSN